MIALAKAKGEPLLPPSGYRGPIVKGLSAPLTSEDVGTKPLDPIAVAAIKAAIEKQQEALAKGKTKPEVDTAFTKQREELDYHVPKPKARKSGKKKLELRTTGKVRDEQNTERKEKARAKAEEKEARRLARKLAQNEQPKPQPVVTKTPALPVGSVDPTIEVCWKQRMNRKEVKTVRVKRTEAYERWFEDNKPEALGFTLIDSPRSELRLVARRQVVRIGNLDVSLGYENVLERVPVGVSRVQADKAVAETARSVFSKSPTMAAEKRQRITEGMQQRLVKIRTPVGATAPWVLTADDMRPKVAANDVTEDVDALDLDLARNARIRHMAYVKYHMPAPRLASRTVYKEPLVTTAVRKSFRSTLASRLANTYHYDVFESGEYADRIKANLLNNATEAALRGLKQNGWSRLFYSAERSANATVHSKPEATLEEQISRLEAMPPIDAMHATFEAGRQRLDLRTKKQRERDALAEQRAAEDVMTKEWVGVNLAQRKELMKQEDTDKVRQAISWLDEQQAISEQADVWNQDAARLDAWLQAHEVHNNRDAELLDQWLMKRSGVGHLAGVLGAMGRRYVVTADDKRYLMWLHDNAGDDYHYERWLHMHQNEPRSDAEPVFTGDNVVSMMEWRHRNRKGKDHKASLKSSPKAVKLNLPKSEAVIIYDGIMRDTALQNDPVRDKAITSFGNVVRDIKEIISKFNMDEGSGLFLPDYLKDTT